MLQHSIDGPEPGNRDDKGEPAVYPAAEPRTSVEIGRGAQGVVYRLASGHIKKKYFDSVSDQTVEREFEHSAMAFAGGVPTWRVDRWLREERTIIGSFEPGVRLARVIRRRPLKAAALMRSLGRLHAQVHAVSAPTERTWHIYDAARSARILKPYLPEETVETIRNLVSASEDGFCHADLSLTNVLCDKDELTVLDWARSGHGPMTADVGRTCAFILGREPQLRLLRPLNRWFARHLAQTYVAAYVAETGRSTKEIWAWTAIFLARKLSQPHPRARIALIKAEMTRLCRSI
jgi:hypothetical protein